MICQVKMKSAYGIRFEMKNEFVHFVFLLPFAIFAKLHAEYPGFGIGLVCFQTRWRGGVFIRKGVYKRLSLECRISQI